MQFKVHEVLVRAPEGPSRGCNGEMSMNLTQPASLPNWLPDAARLYLHHTELGVSLRELARTHGVHASTVMRQVRRFESRRDDPLVDEALSALGQMQDDGASWDRNEGEPQIRPDALAIDQRTVMTEGRRVLRALSEPDAVLAIAQDMEKAAVLRSFPDGRTVRMAVVDRGVAQAFALKDWIVCRKPGRIATYEITAAGRASIKTPGSRGLHEAPSRFAAFDRESAEEEERQRRLRHAAAESPVAVLARRRDKDGKPFLDPALVDAAERLRQDFELSQIGPRVAMDWDRFLTGGVQGSPQAGASDRPGAARGRVQTALSDLGPGLGDMVLRCCCYQEGLETAEQRMGWSARSGKIVLRIALQRLNVHYAETYGKFAPLIG